jgi:uncharacterized repeat protein (TIGR01451 family)
LTCTRTDPLPPGAAYPGITITVNVALDAPLTVVNSATVSVVGDRNPANNTASDTAAINAPDLTIAKTHGKNFYAGQTGATYLIAVTNIGVAPTIGTVTVTDTVPAGLTATAANGAGWNCTGAPVSCTRADVLAPGAAYPSITVTVNVALDAPTSVVNTVTVSGGGDRSPGNNTATDPTTIDTPDLTIAKSHAANFSLGQTGAQYTVTVSNLGPAPSSGTVTVVDTLPAGLTATAISGTGWNCTLGNLACTRTDALAAGNAFPAITVTVNVSVDAALSLVNTATVSGGGDRTPGNNTANDPTQLNGPDLTIAKTHSGNFNVGQIGATFTINVSNVGQGPTVGTVTVVDTLPAGLTATSVSGTGWTCVPGTLTCTRGDVLLQGSAFPPITVTVNVAIDAPLSFTNGAAVFGGGDRNPANNTATDPVTILVPDLTVSKSHTGTFQRAQGGATYTLVVSNVGNGATSGAVALSDALPAGLAATAFAGSGWTCTLTPLSCTRSDALAAGASYPPLTLTVDISATAPLSVINTATVSGGGERNTANNTASDPAAIDSYPDLNIAKSHPGNFTQGQTGTYNIIVANVGTSPTSAPTVVTDAIPAGLTATAISGAGWTCSLSPVSCSRSDILGLGASFPAITVTVFVAANSPLSVVNVATVSGGGEKNTSNDTASDPTTIAGVPDMTLAKSHQGTFTRGKIGTYSLVATNSGTGPSQGTVTVVDSLPAALTATAISGSGWTCVLTTLTCTRSDVLTAGASFPAITLSVLIAGNAPNTVVNNATVSGGGETNTGNDNATDPTPISGGSPVLSLVKTHTGDFARGGSGTYLLTVTNTGTSTTTGTVTAIDNLPSSLTGTSLSGTGWNCDLHSLTCSRSDNLAPGASYPPIYLTVNVANDAPSQILNTAIVSGGGVPTGGLNNGGGGAQVSASDTATISQLLPGLNVAKIADPIVADAGEVVTYRVDVVNSTPGPITHAIVRDQLPLGFAYVVGSAKIINGLSAPLSIAVGNIPGVLVFDIGTLAPQQSVTLIYRVRVTPAARPGNNFNTVRLSGTLPGGNPVNSPSVSVGVRIGSGLFSLNQIVIGRVFEDLNHNGLFDYGERPIAGVRIYLSNGQSATTDSQGLYSMAAVGAGSVAISLDPSTVPGTLTMVDNYVDEYDLMVPRDRLAGRIHRHEGKTWTRLLRTPLGGGTMLRQNFPLIQDPDFRMVEPQPKLPELATEIGTNSKATRLVVAPARTTAMADGRTSTRIEVLLLDAEGKRVRSKPSAEKRVTPNDNCEDSPAFGKDGARVIPTEVRIQTTAGQFIADPGLTPILGKRDVPVESQISADMIERDVTSEAIRHKGTVTLFGTKTRIGCGATTEQVPGRLQTTAVRVVDGFGTAQLLSPMIPGIATIEAETGDPDHRMKADSHIWFSQERRPPILVALGEIAIGHAAPDFSVLGQSGSFARRADAFLRAPVGSSLVTVAYESHLSVNDTTGVRHMFNLDPLDRPYQVYGDSSTQNQLAESNSHLYARIDRGHSYVLYGDLRGDRAKEKQPGLTDYSRSLTGIQLHLENSRRDEVTLEAARPNTAFARDVFPGSAFGLLQLSHPTVTPGTEVITVEVRDRYNPELILTREPLVRSADYSLDWSTGTLFLLRSLSATDSALNLVQLVVTYDYRTTGLSTTVFSVRASKNFNSLGLRLGMSITDQTVSRMGSYYLASVSAEKKLGKHGLLKLEMPMSQGSAAAAGASSVLGAALPASANGTAIRADYQQSFSFLHANLQGTFAKTDTTFYNPFGATVLPGAETIKASVEVSPFKASKLRLGLIDESNKTPLVNNGRKTLSMEWKQSLYERFVLLAGYNYRNFTDTLNARTMQADEVNGEIDLNVTSKLKASLRREQNVTGGDPTYPNQTIISAKYQVSPAVRLFLTERMASQPITPIADLTTSGFTSLGSKNETNIGVEDRWNKYTSMQGRYRVENGLNGTDSFAVIGLVNRIPVTEHLKVDLGIERGTLISGKDTSFNSGSAGLSWLDKRFKAAMRYELRDKGGKGQILTGGVAGKFWDGFTGLARFQHSNSNFTPVAGIANIYNSQQSLVNQGTMAAALRPVKSDREMVLFSYTLRNSDQLGLTGSKQRESVSILSSDGFLQATRLVELYGKIALSHRTTGGDLFPTLSTDTFLMQFRAQSKIRSRFDAAAEFRILGQPATSTERWTAGLEGGFWLFRDVRVGAGYNLKSIAEVSPNFLTNPLRSGPYFVISTKISNIFNLFTSPTEIYVTGVTPGPQK